MIDRAGASGTELWTSSTSGTGTKQMRTRTVPSCGVNLQVGGPVYRGCEWVGGMGEEDRQTWVWVGGMGEKDRLGSSRAIRRVESQPTRT